MSSQTELESKAALPNLPAVFVSHGAPTLAVEENDTTAFLRGFPEELYRINYHAPGAPSLAGRVVELLGGDGIGCSVSAERGLDHGAWVPLRLLYPGADIPVTQLSIQTRLDPAYHLRLGRALAPLRKECVLVLATGSVTHNLSMLAPGGAPPVWAREFDEWLFRKITEGELDELLNYRRLAPHARLAHPTDEHLLPLFVALGAGSNGEGISVGRVQHRGWTVGSLSMAAYSFGSGD
ncbi:MAG: dioxygenase [Acidobacteria bacterium]|nr:dioxygenase [Acidobacteriota bacterium]